VSSINSSPGRNKFGEDAALYDFARPGYPPELFDWLIQTCGLGPTSRCFEIGAGTGLATLPLLNIPIGSILAIEPDPGLAARLRQKVGEDPRASIAIAKFEDQALVGGAYDFGCAATAFHWLKRMKALAKVAAALKPGGSFAMWWNVFHNPASPDLIDRATAHLFKGLEQDPEATADRPAFALDAASRQGEMRAAGLKDVQHTVFELKATFTPDQVAALYATFSRVRMAPEALREDLLAEVARIARQEFGEVVTRSFSCSAYAGRRSTSA
jgi:SAM-dependent methyltransferase